MNLYFQKRTPNQSQSKSSRTGNSSPRKLLKPTRYNDLKEQFDSIIKKDRKNKYIQFEKEESPEGSRLPSLQKSPKLMKNSIQIYSPKSPFKNYFKNQKVNMKISLINSSSLQQSSKKQNPLKNQSKLLLSPKLKKSKSTYVEFKCQQLIYPQDLKIEEENVLFAFHQPTHKFMKLARKGDEEQRDETCDDRIFLRIFGKVKKEESNFFAMTYEFKFTLTELVQSFGNFTEKLIKKYLKQLLKCIQVCHDNQCYHNKITIDNIYSNTKGEIRLNPMSINTGKIPKKQLYNNGFYSFSPEILLRGKFTYKNDIWAIGCVALALAKGKKINPEVYEHPYNFQLTEESENAGQVDKVQKKFMKKCSMQIKNQLDVELSENLSSLIEGCLRMNERDRFTVNQVENHSFLLD